VWEIEEKLLDRWWIETKRDSAHFLFKRNLEALLIETDFDNCERHAGTDLRVHARKGAVFAGYHYDLNFLTIHGKSRYPGLHVWLRDGTKVPVRIPEGCLLLQAGRQLAWLTGGMIQEGMHEVVCTEETLKAVERAKLAGKKELWRVSSTVFAHLAPHVMMRPLLVNVGAAHEEFPETLVADYISRELRTINLMRDSFQGECKV
jgi:isopenicillin N synthase-like dioxygenase